MEPLQLSPRVATSAVFQQPQVWTLRRVVCVLVFGLVLPFATLALCAALSPLECPPRGDVNASDFVREYLSECVYDRRDAVNFGVGLLCMMAWSLCLTPQIVVNHVNGKAEDQSFLFYLLWVAGDVTNLLGCIIARQLATQIGVAVIYLVLTSLLFVQFLYYNCAGADGSSSPTPLTSLRPSPTKFRTFSFGSGSRTPLFSAAVAPAASKAAPSRSVGPKPDEAAGLLFGQPGIKDYGSVAKSEDEAKDEESKVGGGLRIEISRASSSEPIKTKTVALGASEELPDAADKCCPGLVARLTEKNISVVIIVSFVIVVALALVPDLLSNAQIAFLTGWAMTVYYTISRVPQIMQIWATRRVTGLTPIMFIMTSVGNITYILQIFLVSTDPAFIRDKIPWIAQAGLCIFQDVLLLALYFAFSK